MEFLGVGVQHIQGTLGRRRGNRRVRRRLAAWRPVLAGACAEPAVLPIGIDSSKHYNKATNFREALL